MHNKLFVVGNTERKFPAGPLDKKVLEDLPMIFREEGSGTRVVMERYIEKNKLPIQKKMELTSNEAVKQAVISGLGYSIMPLIGLRNELQNKDLQIIPVKGFPVKSTWSIVWQKSKNFSPVAEAYLSYLKKEKDKIIHDRFKWFDAY